MILVIGDLHFKPSNIKEARLLIEKIIPIIKQNSIKHVVLLGDLHNDFERIHSLVSVEIYNLFTSILSAIDGNLYYIIGNHDAINNQIFLNDNHAFVPFKGWQRVIVVDRPQKITNEILAIPYVPPGRLLEAIEASSIDMGQVKLVFCHQEFRGVQLGPHPSKVGDVWPEDWPLVISGHIHEQQWLQRNIFYAGEPYDTSFGSSGDKNIFIINQLDASDMVAVDLDMPKKITMTLTIAELKDYLPPENSSVRIFATGTTEEWRVFQKGKQYKELSKTVKIVPKLADMVVVRNVARNGGYFEILTELIGQDSANVQKIYKEIQDMNSERK